MRSLRLKLFLVIWALVIPLLAVQAEEEFLQPEEAFQFIHLVNDVDGNRDIILQWQIAEGYYLYQHRTKVLADGKEIRIEKFPKGVTKHDEYFGEITAHYNFLDIPLKAVNAKQLEIQFQGCADAGLCYPPMTAHVNLDSEAMNADKPETPIDSRTTSKNPWSIDNDFELIQLLNNGSTLTVLLLFFAAGIVTAFAGCSYPMFPILSRIIVGEGKTITRGRAFSLSLAYVLPIAVVYALLGIVAGYFGSNLSSWFQTPIALSIVACILITMALSMFGLYELQMPSAIQSRLNTISNQQQGGTFLGAIVMGIISAFIVSACSVPPIVAAITYIAQSGDTLLGAASMFLFGLGLGFPLLLLGLSASWLLPKAGNWMNAVQKVMGIFLLSAAIYILSRFLPEWVSLSLWILLALSVGIALLWKGQSIIPKVAGGLSVVLAIALASQLNNLNILKKVQFTVINTPTELEKIIAQSQRPVLVDYYADWCTSCIKMEKQIYPLPTIKDKLDLFTRVKIDLTQMSVEKENIMQSHQVVGPPAILFFSTQGAEQRELRITGEVSADSFERVLEEVLQRTL